MSYKRGVDGSKFIMLALVLVGFVSCDQDYAPKPRGYIHIDLPEKGYRGVETDCPFMFETATYSNFVPDNRAQAEPCWFNIEYPQFKAKFHFSYKPIKNNLQQFLEESRTLTNKHISKATYIDETLILRNEERVFGMLYSIEGSQAASPLQLYLTDSTHHFLRGALYFNVSPNNDSLAPVIDLLKDDVLHLIATLNWQQHVDRL
ncbi:MAG: gliding motility lipoprotein GldD [Flavobacteriales bacterium]|nr:gliding motility lipoprotein GldD [Flavobacteriales bacterium]